MIRTTRAVLATAVPTAALALSVLLASAAVAPEAVTAPESTPTSAPLPVPTATASSTALPWPSSATRSGRDSDTDAATACCTIPSAESTSAPAAPVEDVDPEGSPDSTSPTATPAPQDPERLPEQQDAGGVDVGVRIDPPTGPGALSMTVAGSAATLVESGSTPLRRQFLGALPRITVTDTRDPAQGPAASGWYVLGTASDFTGASGASIGAAHLGWTPELAGSGGAVSAGPRVSGVLDGGSGVRDAVLVGADDDSPAQAGSWSATADLILATEPTVAAGAYRSTLTLSLFE
ncbi:hypothetical protein [Rathayibacter sp. PhB127]|uniref:hypothetical protein n=1 Tax=Rathayibacter sp. PhB127 TaxID=2485176 RepID=UPI000F4BE2D3|nr:hypothetical protein [Rathayibacter sp. PhB127]